MPLQTGDRLGLYEIVSAIGAGGMGEVYRAQDTKLQRDVAIKVLPDRFSRDPEKLDRFEREARAVAQLSHPNIVAIHELETRQGITYAVIELLEGETLRELLKRGAVPWRKSVDIITAVADGLSAAHSKGITHRDLKPENLFLTKDGTVKILDFGLARVESVFSSQLETEKRTEPGTVLGTVGYMSPEQVQGEKADARSDLFSLGCVFYEMLTGEHAFVRHTAAETMTAILKEEPPELTQPAKQMPPGLSRVVHHCLEKNPAQRFQSARDLAFDLKAISIDSSDLMPSQKPARRRAPIFFAGVAVLAALLAAVVFLRQLEQTAPITTDDAKNRVAVEAFANRTADPYLDSLGAMAADWITQGLSELSMIEVVPATTTPAERLRAGTVVTGNYYLQGDTIVFQSNVVDKEREEIIYALRPVSGSRDSPVDVMENLRQRVMAALAFRFAHTGGWDYRRFTPPSNMKAFREFTTGIEYFGKDYKRAMRHLENAAEIDPNFVYSRLTLAVALGNQGQWAEAETHLRVVYEDREKANPYERMFTNWYMARTQGNLTEAHQVLRQMETLDPSVPNVKYLIGFNALRLNRPQEAVNTLTQIQPLEGAVVRSVSPLWHRQALAAAHHLLRNYQQELDVVREACESFPESISLSSDEARVLAALGKVEQVNKVINECLRMPPRPITPGDVMLEAAEELRVHGHLEASKKVLERCLDWHESRDGGDAAADTNRYGLARTLFLTGQWNEAKKILEELHREYPDNIDYLGYLGALAVREGNSEQARRISADLENLDRPFLFGRHMYWRACIAALQGDQEQAVQLLRDALAQGLPFDWRFHRDVNLEPLRDYPPFQELIRPKG